MPSTWINRQVVYLTLHNGDKPVYSYKDNALGGTLGNETIKTIKDKSI
jgi:hypothetical protein